MNSDFRSFIAQLIKEREQKIPRWLPIAIPAWGIAMVATWVWAPGWAYWSLVIGSFLGFGFSMMEFECRNDADRETGRILRRAKRMNVSEGELVSVLAEMLPETEGVLARLAPSHPKLDHLRSQRNEVLKQMRQARIEAALTELDPFGLRGAEIQSLLKSGRCPRCREFLRIISEPQRGRNVLCAACGLEFETILPLDRVIELQREAKEADELAEMEKSIRCPSCGGYGELQKLHMHSVRYENNPRAGRTSITYTLQCRKCSDLFGSEHTPDAVRERRLARERRLNRGA